jgi:hypothetical protein
MITKLFENLKIKGQIMWGILTGTLAITAIYYIFPAALVFGHH